MNLPNNHFAQLAQQARNGNTQARAQMLKEMQPHLSRMLSHALAPTGPLTPVHRRLLAVRRQLQSGAGPEAGDRERLTQLICQRVVNRAAPVDTDAFAHTFRG